jgi:hypothetical protein
VSVSLDKRVIPVGVWPESAPRLLLSATAALLLLFLVAQLPFMSGVHNAVRAFCDKHNIELYDKLTYRYRCVRWVCRSARLCACLRPFDPRLVAATC